MSVERDAIQVLYQRGWTKGVVCDQDGSVCMNGALAIAVGIDITQGDERVYGDLERDVPEVLERVCSVLHEQFPERVEREADERAWVTQPMTVFRFNDYCSPVDETQFADVVAVLEKAAVLAEERV